MDSQNVIASAQVLLVIAGPKCGILNRTKTAVPLKDLFQGIIAPSLWLASVAETFPELPEGFLSVSPDDTFASVADRIAEYLNSTR